MDEQRRVFRALVGELLDCVEPYGLAAALAAELLAEVEELCGELERFLDDLLVLDAAREPALPPVMVRDFRSDLRKMRSLGQHFQLGALFSNATRRRCGMAGVPILAAALCSIEIWIDFAYQWLEATERIRIRANARAARESRGPSDLRDPSAGDATPT